MDLLPLSRLHEQVLFSVYAVLGNIGLAACQRKIISQVQFESTLSLVWLSMILAISFLEAWVKFKAPFLRKHVAVDVGRHVFSALTAVELALAGMFWLGRFVLPATTIGAAVVAPAIATACFVSMSLFLAPLLYIRAKFQIVDALKDDKQLADKENSALAILITELQDKPKPDAKWHVVYVLLEMVKAGSLVAFLIGNI